MAVKTMQNFGESEIVAFSLSNYFRGEMIQYNWEGKL